MHRIYVVAAVEIVIDKDFPVASQLVATTLDKAELRQGADLSGRGETLSLKRGGESAEIHEDEWSPGLHGHWDQAILVSSKFVDILEFGRPTQTAGRGHRSTHGSDSGAGCFAYRLRHHTSRPMATNIEECSEDARRVTHDKTGSPATRAVTKEPGVASW